MKKQNTKKTKLIYIFIIGFILAIGLNIYNQKKSSQPSYLKSIDFSKEVDISIDKTFNKNGCYDIGFYSTNNTLVHYKIKGEYELSYFHNGKEVKKKTINDKTSLGYAFSRRGGTKVTSSSIMIDTIEIPFKTYKKLTIKFKTIDIDKTFSDTNDISFFIDDHVGLCGKERQTYLTKKNNPIEKAETNTTLKPLFKALKTKDTQKVKELIESGISPNATMIGKRTPLHYTAFYNDTKNMQYLISKKVDLNVKDIIGKTPLHYGIERNATKAVKLLLDSGADLKLVKEVENTYIKYPRANSKSSPLSFATMSNLVELTEILVQHGADINYISPKCNQCTVLCGTRLEYLNMVMRSYYGNYEYDKKMGRLGTNYDKMINILEKYGAKTCKELQQEQNQTKGHK